MRQCPKTKGISYNYMFLSNGLIFVGLTKQRMEWLINNIWWIVADNDIFSKVTILTDHLYMNLKSIKNEIKKIEIFI